MKSFTQVALSRMKRAIHRHGVGQVPALASVPPGLRRSAAGGGGGAALSLNFRLRGDRVPGDAQAIAPLGRSSDQRDLASLLPFSVLAVLIRHRCRGGDQVIPLGGNPFTQVAPE